MAITDPLILPSDVLLVPVAELPDELRARLRCEEGDYAVTRPRSRTASRVVDAQAAVLLGEFKSPCTIVEAVLRYSRAREVDPQKTLEEAYPLLQTLLNAGLLVPEGDAGAAAIQPSLLPGEEIAGFEVIECVQGLDDTELYQVRQGATTAALKIERPAAAGRTGLFEREAAVLERLAGQGAPRLLASGEIDGRRYLAIEWFPGVDAETAADELRRAGDREVLLALCRAVVRAYASLHERGVIHGDVHPRNVLVAGDGSVRLIDFGIAGIAGIARRGGFPESLAQTGRGGVAFFFEPEYASAVLGGDPPPEASLQGEQYGVAALLYRLAAGVHGRDFSLEKEEMLRQIAEEPPLPFAARGIDPWPDFEAILARALSKAPGERFGSMAEMAAALDRVAVPEDRSRPSAPGPAEALLSRVLERIGMDGPLLASGLPAAPRASLTYGAAGIACACYRLAQTREDPALLSLADLWAARALHDGEREDAFYDAEIDITPEVVGRVSPYHTASGIHAVQTLISHALGDGGSQREAMAAFLAASREPCANPDLTLGRSGALLAAALLLDTKDIKDGKDSKDAQSLTVFGNDLLAGLWRELDAEPAIALSENLGMAHGWAGYLYATLRWCRSAGAARPGRLAARLAELGEASQLWGRGRRWPWHQTTGKTSMPGWCNGSAGFVHLWTLAHRELGDPAFAALAEGAAWNAWESREEGGSLCCGLAGRAYALLNLHRHGGAREWLDRARVLADRAALEIERVSEREDSLYKGKVGVALLAADLARPETAVMPFFEEEGWITDRIRP
ncbi:MAG: eukaryotic-like serine/threonine-protein kinase [Acidobacteriota bacterium]|jgi:serine/threonine-protein kinase|nr:eukaryotic-like serine/threonine-protein kinase [Acidobacteriota bacterium]